MKTIGILGSKGLLGQHLIFFIASRFSGYKIIKAPRNIFQNQKKLTTFLRSSDHVFWFAWKNRGSSLEITEENKYITDSLFNAMLEVGSEHAPGIIFTSSVHENQSTPYGKAKKYATSKINVLRKKKFHAISLPLPHVFGEFGTPYHNSVVSTFCYNAVNGKPLELLHDQKIDLAYAQDVIKHLWDALNSTATPLPSKNITISSIKRKIETMWNSYEQQAIFPALKNQFEVQLFNTLRSYQDPSLLQKKYALNSDPRGDLAELSKSLTSSQTFFSITQPGHLRGNHFHTQKIERFMMIDGNYEIKIRKIDSKKVYTFNQKSSMSYIDMPTFFTHNIRNTSKTKKLQALFWANELFDPENPDTFYMEV
jgi:UDP-2-acetamido-2,6-beta-L-arabino-hexul-4-ose reductase